MTAAEREEQTRQYFRRNVLSMNNAICDVYGLNLGVVWFSNLFTLPDWVDKQEIAKLISREGISAKCVTAYGEEDILVDIP